MGADLSIYGMFKGTGSTGFGYNSTTDDVTEGLDLSGKTYLVTGCNSGLGEDTVRVLAKRGARIVGAARTIDKATKAMAPLAGEGHIPVACELSEPASVRAAVTTVIESGVPLDGIIANAGIMALPKRQLQYGYEMQFFTNHVGHFILVTGLIDQLVDTGRVVMLSSYGHTMTWPEGVRLDDLASEEKYARFENYGQSKLCNLLFARHLATRLPKPTQTANAVHPGVIATNLGRHMPAVVNGAFKVLGPVFATKMVSQGAATQTYVAVHPDSASVNGEYWSDCNVVKSIRHGADPVLAAALWEKTEEIVAGLA